MHSRVIILLKKDKKVDIIEKVKKFLRKHEGKEWDWWVIGGRFNQRLSPFFQRFKEKAISLGLWDGKHINLNWLENNEIQKSFQGIWENIGAKGLNPICGHYKLPEEGNYYDIMPLGECLERVRDYSIIDHTYIKNNKKIQDKIKKEKFCFECNVFNIESNDYHIPEDVFNYVAVNIDMHK